MNLASIIILCIVFLGVAAAVVYMIVRAAKGKNITCSGNCAGCAVGCAGKKFKK